MNDAFEEAKRAYNQHYAREKAGDLPALRSFRPSCDARRRTWTADGPAEVDIDEISGIPVITPNNQGPVIDPPRSPDATTELWDGDTSTVYADLEELYPETVKRLNMDE